MVRKKGTVLRVDSDFSDLTRAWAVKHDLRVSTVTKVLAMRIKGQDLMEVKDKKGNAKKLTFRRLRDIKVSELFDDINL